MVVDDTATPFGVHQLQEVAQIDLIWGQFTHPLDPASKYVSPPHMSSLYHGKALQSTTSGAHAPDDPPRQFEQSFLRIAT